MNLLLDPYGRQHDYLRISVTDRCNLRCLYCMPEESIDWQPREALLDFDEIERVARVAVGLGIRKIRVTGGEPFVRRGLSDLLKRIRAIDGLDKLAVTTNGILLARHLPELRGVVDQLNISLDTLRPDRFKELTQRDRYQVVRDSIDLALDGGFEVKLNAVAMRGVNDDEFVDFAALAMKLPLAVRFIEFMPFAGNDWSEGRFVPMQEILAAVESAYDLRRLPDPKNLISRDYRLTERRTATVSSGTFGVIASMSQPFCSTCSRIRMTAEGKIMPCLHSSIEFDLRNLLRRGADDDQIAELFHTALSRKPAEHAGAEELTASTNRVMIQIGG